MKSVIHIVASLCTNEGFTKPNKEKPAWTKSLGIVLKMRTNENAPLKYAWTKDLVNDLLRDGQNGRKS